VRVLIDYAALAAGDHDVLIGLLRYFNRSMAVARARVRATMGAQGGGGDDGGRTQLTSMASPYINSESPSSIELLPRAAAQLT
jgi:hypothetical protein